MEKSYLVPFVTDNVVSDDIRSLCHRKMDAVGHFIFKTLPQCYSRVVAYLIKDNTLKEMCVKTLDIHVLIF